MKGRLAPLAENVGEATAACLIAMVQGNLFAVSLTHWGIALRTGVFAGAATALALFFMRTTVRWRIAIVLGVVTAIVDYLVHPGQIGPGVTEAVLTGVGAGALSLIVGSVIQRLRPGRRVA